MTRRDALKSLVAVLVASPFLRLPEPERCTCGIPLASFEEWRAAKPTVTVHKIGFEGSDEVLDFSEAVDRLEYSIDTDILRSLLKRTCPQHGGTDGMVKGNTVTLGEST